MALIRIELAGWTIHLEVGRAGQQPEQQTTDPPVHIAPPMQVWAPERVGFLPPDPRDDH